MLVNFASKPGFFCFVHQNKNAQFQFWSEIKTHKFSHFVKIQESSFHMTWMMAWLEMGGLHVL